MQIQMKGLSDETLKQGPVDGTLNGSSLTHKAIKELTHKAIKELTHKAIKEYFSSLCHLRCTGIMPCFSVIFIKGNNFCDFLFAPPPPPLDKVLPKGIYQVLLTLLHSERPKLYTILAFVSAIGLRKKLPP